MKTKSCCVLIGLSSLCVVVFIGGCNYLPLLEPKGPIGDSERFVIIAAFVLMLIVVVPVFILSHWFAWKYRASNTKATYRPKWSYSAKIDLGMWLVPFAIITALGVLSWIGTHRLDPYRSIDSDVRPVNIEVVCLDWKWLFIYPEHNIAGLPRTRSLLLFSSRSWEARYTPWRVVRPGCIFWPLNRAPIPAKISNSAAAVTPTCSSRRLPPPRSNSKPGCKKPGNHRINLIRTDMRNSKNRAPVTR